jgi:hypothetical protein
MSKVSGWSKTAGSRLAAGYQTTTLSPASKVWVTCPFASVSVTSSRVTVRRMWITGLAYRRISSIAVGASSS